MLRKLRQLPYMATAVVIVGLLPACNKNSLKQAEPRNTVAGQTAQARDLTDGEAALLAADVNNFAFYADDYLANPSAPVPQNLAASFDVEGAVQLLENTYNFLYSERTDELFSSSTKEVQVTVPKDPAGMIATADIASAYNTSFTILKNEFNAIGAQDRKLTVVDVEMISETGSSAVLSLTGHFAWSHIAPPSGASASTGTFLDVPPGEFWHWANRGGMRGSTFYDGTLGAPELIAMYVRAYKGYYSPASAVRGMKPVNVESYTSRMGAGTFARIQVDPSLPPGSYVSPDDGYRLGLQLDNCLFWKEKYGTIETDDPLWAYISSAAVNYHVRQCPVLLDRVEAYVTPGHPLPLVPQEIWSFRITADMTTFNRMEHYTEGTRANRVKASIVITGTDPYRHGAPRPF